MYKFNSNNSEKNKKKINKQIKNLNYPETNNGNINYTYNVEINLNDKDILNENKILIQHKKNNSSYIGNEFLKKRNIKNEINEYENINISDIYKIPISNNNNNVKMIFNNYKELINEEDNILKDEEEQIKNILNKLDNDK